MHRGIVATGIGLVAAAACSVAGGQPNEAYQIKLSRPVAKGHQYHFVAESVVQMTTTADTGRGARQLVSIDMTVRMDSEVQVLAVDGFGRPSAVAHVINECVMVRHGVPTVIVNPGETLIARQQGFEMHFFVKKKRFNDIHQIALESVADLAAYGADDDRLYGTDEPRRFGDHWRINAAAVAADLRRVSRHELGAENVAGTVSLLGFKNLGGLPCGVVGIDMVARGGVPGVGDLPPGSTLEDAVLQTRHYKLMPLDTTLPIPADETMIDLEITFRGRLAAQPAKGKIASHVQTRRQFMPVPLTVSADPQERGPGQ